MPTNNESADRLDIQHVETVDVVCPHCGQSVPNQFFDEDRSGIRNCGTCMRRYRYFPVPTIFWTTVALGDKP